VDEVEKIFVSVAGRSKLTLLTEEAKRERSIDELKPQIDKLKSLVASGARMISLILKTRSAAFSKKIS